MSLNNHRQPLINAAKLAEPPSKTQRKTDSTALQKLGVALQALPASAWEELQLPEILVNALHETARVRSHEGLRRHRQLIGKLMRELDPAPIQAFLTARERGVVRERQQQHAAELWRAELLANKRDLAQFMTLYPQAPLAELEKTLQRARKELANNESSTHTRVLYRSLLKALQAKPTLSQVQEAPPLIN